MIYWCSILKLCILQKIMRQRKSEKNREKCDILTLLPIY